MDISSSKNHFELSKSSYSKDIKNLIINIVDIIEFNKRINNNESIPPDLAKRVVEFYSRAIIEDTNEFEYYDKIPDEDLVLETYERFDKYDYPNPFKTEQLNELEYKDSPKDLRLVIRAVYQYLMNLDESEVERPLQYYEKAYLFITTFVDEHYKLKSKKLFKHYQRAALATYIVVKLKIVVPPKNEPMGGYTNENLVEISKNALKPVMKRF